MEMRGVRESFPCSAYFCPLRERVWIGGASEVWIFFVVRKDGKFKRRHGLISG